MAQGQRQTNLNQNQLNTNRNVNNTNINRDVNVNGDHGYYHGGGYYGGWGGYGVGAGIAAGAAAGLTAAAIGSVAYSLPPSCATVYSYGSPYYHCGSTYYAPQYQGDDVTYVVVQPPEGSSE